MNAGFIYEYYLPANIKQITSAKRVTPSTSAAAIIIVVLISPLASGCLPIASMAEAANLPIPRPAPITASPAPMPAANAARLINNVYPFFSFLFRHSDGYSIVLY